MDCFRLRARRFGGLPTLRSLRSKRRRVVASLLAMTGKQAFSFPRHGLPEVLPSRCPSLVKRAQGKPGASRTRSLACESEKHTSKSTTGSARTTRLSPRNGFNDCFVLSPVSGLFCHRRHVGLTTRLDARVAAPGPHDFAVRRERFARRASPPDATASIASRAQRFVTTAKRPSVGAGRRGLCT